MTKFDSLPYPPVMFATCMLFQVIYVACVVLWVFFPELKGHALLVDIFPQFKLLDIPSFVYGLIISTIYGWVISAVFVFFYSFTIGGLASSALSWAEQGCRREWRCPDSLA